MHRLKSVVEHSYRNVPFYRERMQTLNETPDSITDFEDFRRLHTVTKTDIAANFPDRITARGQDSTSWQYVSTSGTIERLTVIQDFAKRDIVRTTQLFSLTTATGYLPGMKYMEIPPDICANVCGAANTVEPNVFRYFIDSLKSRKLLEPEVTADLRGLVERQIMYRRVQLPSFSSEGLLQKPEVLDEYLCKINDYQPYVVKALPIYLYLLAVHIIDRKRRPPRIAGGLMPMGSSMSPYMKRVVEEAFNAKVHEDYGCAEMGVIATECGWQRGLHPLSGLFYVEVVQGNVPVGEGELGKVLITDLYNYAMPLIRYEIGDVAVVRRDQCLCGLSSPRLEMQGRVQDCLVASDGTVLSADNVTDRLLKRADILGFQVELQQEGSLSLQLVPREGHTLSIENVKQDLVALLGETQRIAARVVPTILPEPGGKYRFIKNRSKAIQEIF